MSRVSRFDMGCDIHLYAERKDGDKWKMIKGEFKQYNDTYGDEIDVGRNYELFAFLADVRNSDHLKPLSQPRGIPDDASLGYRAEVEDWDCDGHSHSYFTIEELKNIDKNLIEQEINDGSLILAKNDDGTIKETCRSTNGKHLGPVGKRRIFTLWGEKENPIEEIIRKVNDTMYGDLKDSDKRVVFFFDN